MVRILKLVAYILFFILALIYFISKVSVYYYVEKKLEENKIVLSHETAIDSGLSLKLNKASISYKAIESATVKNIDIKMLLLYNSISAQDIELSSMASSFVPLHIKTLDVRYAFFNPLNIVAQASGEFGEASGRLNILDKNITILLKPSKLMLNQYRNTLNNFRKNKSGEYEYVKTF